MNLFAGAWEARDATPLPVDIPLATDSQVSQSLTGTSWEDFCSFCRSIQTFFHIYTLDSELHRAGESSQETSRPAGKPSDATSNASRCYQVLYSWRGWNLESY